MRTEGGDPVAVLHEAIEALAIPASADLLVAISGGPDSVALLDAVATLSTAPGHIWTVQAAHVNHGMRGVESDADEQFVREYAAKLGVGLEVVRVDTREFALQNRVSLELAARTLRYEALERVREASHCFAILVAHNADDQVETILMHLLRGAGLRGLGGMEPVQGYLCRPFLSIRREVILEALQKRGLGYRLDSSNANREHFRNRVRHDLVPLMANLAPGVTERVARMGDSVRAGARYLAGETDAALENLDVVRTEGRISASARLWRRLHPALATSVAQALAAELVGFQDLDAKTVHEIGRVIHAGQSGEARSGGLMHALVVTAEASRVTISAGPLPRAQPLEPATLTIPGSLRLACGELGAAELPTHDRTEMKRMLTVCGRYHAVCDGDALGSALLVRSRRPGERMRPLGSPGNRKVQDIMVDSHLPEAVRDGWPVVDSGERAIWIPGAAMENCVAVGQHTKRAILLSFRPR
ncbi:MAG: tRNA lysidine(34) synthetase TilS [Chloroflexota bacterium]